MCVRAFFCMLSTAGSNQVTLVYGTVSKRETVVVPKVRSRAFHAHPDFGLLCSWAQPSAVLSCLNCIHTIARPNIGNDSSSEAQNIRDSCQFFLPCIVGERGSPMQYSQLWNAACLVRACRPRGDTLGQQDRPIQFS